MPRWFLGACFGALACTGSLSATTTVALTFDEIVSRADMVFVGEVIDVRPFRLRTRDGSVIKTRVVFRVTEPLTRGVGIVEVLEFLGGELDGVGMAVADMPRFTIGDRRVVFARRERSINPIVGFTQGLLRVAADASRVDRVWTLDGSPVAGITSIGGLQAGPAVPAGTPMSLAELRAQILRALPATRRR